jgi:hypothetical protein
MSDMANCSAQSASECESVGKSSFRMTTRPSTLKISSDTRAATAQGPATRRDALHYGPAAVSPPVSPPVSCGCGTPHEDSHLSWTTFESLSFSNLSSSWKQALNSCECCPACDDTRKTASQNQVTEILTCEPDT